MAACSSRRSFSEGGSKVARYNVSLPDVKLLPDEYIQKIEVEVHDGRVSSVNRILADWSAEVLWDTPVDVKVTCQAGHFVSGLRDTKPFANFITIEPSPLSRIENPPSRISHPESRISPLRLSATIHTSSPIPAHRDNRDLPLSPSEMILTPLPSR